jgi:hypothetical protein
MRTQKMIMLIVLATMLVGVAVAWGVLMWLGVGTGLVVLAAVAVVLALLLVLVVRPWYTRWGATDAEISMGLPGDDLIADAPSVTRAIGIAAEPKDIWPWLVQLGFGKAGWYSYDWIDNDGEPSAGEILPEFQNLEPGDRILMMPTMGFEVKAVDPPRSIVSVLDDGSTSWVLSLVPGDNGTRLLSRWRPQRQKFTAATAIFAVITGPGSFIMEQKMLRGIRDRTECMASAD